MCPSYSWRSFDSAQDKPWRPVRLAARPVIPSESDKSRNLSAQRGSLRAGSWRLYSGILSAKSSPEDRRSPMSKTSRLEQVEQECKERGVRLIYDDLRSEGGLCRLRGSYYVILNRRLAAETKTRIIADALARMREMIDKGHDRNQPGISDRVPVSADRVPSVPLTDAAEPTPAMVDFPESVYEEPGVGVPVTAGVPDSQS
jgi:hypothetical protein